MNLAILGPTASGKSALALAVARRSGGTVVNGDPFQALQGLAIGTGQPTHGERQEVPHVGYGLLPLATRLNPADFGELARGWLDAATGPVLVTGSGLYLRGIWGQLDDLPAVPPEAAAEVRRWHLAEGAQGLHARLAAVDPARAAALHPNDSARLLRALALHLATGRRPSELLTGVPRGVPPGWRALLVLPARDRQRERVARRVQAMVAQGWAEEVRQAVAAGHREDLLRLRPLGYGRWLEGGEEAAIVARITLETQAYAKRQGTWFRNQLPGLPTWDPDTGTLDEALARLG